MYQEKQAHYTGGRVGVHWIGLYDIAGECGKAGGCVRGLIGSGCMIWQEHVVLQMAVCVGSLDQAI